MSIGYRWGLEKTWGHFNLSVWREVRLVGEWYRFRIRPVEEYDGNIHVYDFPPERVVGGFIWGEMLNGEIEQAVSPYCHYEEE